MVGSQLTRTCKAQVSKVAEGRRRYFHLMEAGLFLPRGFSNNVMAEQMIRHRVYPNKIMKEGGNMIIDVNTV